MTMAPAHPLNLHRSGAAPGSERALLLACCRSQVVSEDRAAVARHLDHPVRWPQFVHAARGHRIIPLVFNALREQPAVPSAVLASLKAISHRIAWHALYLAGQCGVLVQALAGEGISALPFKGPALAQQLYGQVVLRTTSDLDLLVRPEQFRAARSFLLNRGFTPLFPTSSPVESRWLAGLTGAEEDAYLQSVNEYHLLSPDQRFDIDLHQRITAADFPLALETEDLLKRAVPGKLAGVAIPVLAPEDTLLMLCANGGKDCWNQLLRVVDVAALLTRFPQLKLASLMKESEDLGCARMVQIGLLLARDLFDAPLPPWLAQRLHADNNLKQIRQTLLDHLFADALAPVAFSRLQQLQLHMRLRETWREKWRCCRGNLRPSVGDFTAVPLPESMGFLYRLLRPVRVAGKIASG